MISFAGYPLRFITVTGVGRKAELFATMVNILSNTTDIVWDVCFQYDSDTFEQLPILQAIAQSNNSVINVHHHNPGWSVGQSKAEVIKYLSLDSLIFNVDDDHIIPYKTLSMLQYALRKGFCEDHVVTCAAVDVLDIHGYEDWSNKPRSVAYLPEFISRFGIKSVAHQKWDTVNAEIIRTDYISNGWIMPVKYFHLVHEPSAAVVLDVMSTWKKGVRGYDCMIQEAVVGNGIGIYLLLGAYIEHVGMKTFDWGSSVENHSEPYKRQLASRLANHNTPISTEYL